jgi:transcriptional regulator with XRE-family HTH domain
MKKNEAIIKFEKYRRRKKITLLQAADMLCMNRTTYWRLLNGRTAMPDWRAEKIKEFMEKNK